MRSFKSIFSVRTTLMKQMTCNGKMIGSYLFIIATAILVISSQTLSAQQRSIQVNGVVLDEKGDPMPGVAVVNAKDRTSGTATNVRGTYALFVSSVKDSLEFSFLGYKKQVICVRDASLVRMSPDDFNIDEVVVTGIYTRKAESYTGASTTFSKSELTRVGNQNVLESLKNLDPSIYMPDNMTMGSDPNSTPTLSMRGTSSFPADASSTSFKSNYQNQPNQPLFILDGFETSVETVMDMDMNRIESLTILKDAAAKALYGSKAANGVIVIETKRLRGNEQRVTYTGSLSIEAPDLTSYDLCNALEKLEVERLEGVYNSYNPDELNRLTNLYNSRKKLALEGLDTYWLSKPLRTGIGQKHNISVELGNENLRVMLDASYNQTSGVMKGSDRTNFMGNVNVSYRTKNVTFRNIMSVISNKSEDSPYGTFSDYVKMNPFWQATDATGNIVRWAEGELADGSTTKIPNPMYDAVIGTSLTSDYLKFTNNFYAEWTPIEGLKTTARVGISQQNNNADSFYPSTHSMFADYTSTEQINRRGKYILENGKSTLVSADLNVNYNKTFGKHSFFTNVGAFISESKYSAYQHTAEGFPNNNLADITFARQYAEGTTPVGTSSLNREVSFLGTLSYDYENRYLAEATYRASASSLYGKDNRWASNYSFGVGWNLHNEHFMKDIEWFKQFKVRGSLGLTGNNSFNTNSAIATYQYYTGVNYQGQTGAYLAQLANSQLRWEQKMDYNVGVDMRIQNLGLSFDYYISDTENMLTDITIPTSTGFSTVKDNLGKVRNKGYEIKANYTLWQNKDGYFNLYGTLVHNQNEIIRLSDSMKAYNDAMLKTAENQGTSTPVLMYQDGLSMNTIWAVPSAGIDPTTGKEIYIKKNGTQTFTYDSSDMIAAGDADPKYRGTFGFTGEYKGIGLSATFSFLTGCEMYNYTLVDRVENIDVNYNVDRRVLLGRWQNPGDIVQFKRLTGTFMNEDGETVSEVTRATTRFVQDRSELSLSTLSVYYELPRKFIEPLKMERMRVQFYMNDVAQWSSIKIERGLSYPFARTMSFSLTATF
ncbi:MAG: SusC/RagA family TonB-linked outer membrane protein [Bacteroides sp.]|nr:SusC/RagA family TonB-linked outer membrane protein [Bacteroides sp.]